MYEQVLFSDVHFYYNLGLIKVNHRLLNPRPYWVYEDQLNDLEGEVIWLRSFIDLPSGRVSYGFDVTFYNGGNYRTIEVIPNILRGCDSELKVIQRVVRRRVRMGMLKKSVAAVQSLRGRLPLDLIFMCLPWNACFR